MVRRKLKKQVPHMVADGISQALQTIFDELCQVHIHCRLPFFGQLCHVQLLTSCVASLLGSAPPIMCIILPCSRAEVVL